MPSLPDKKGHFGPYGGKFVPETLMGALAELEAVYRAAKRDKSFHKELNGYLHDFAGRETPLTETKRLAKLLGVKRFFSSAKTCCTPVRTRSIIPSDKCF